MVTRIVRDCDQHAQDDQYVPAGEWVVTLAPPGEKPTTFQIDLCPECEKPLLALSELFSEIARASKTPAAPAATTPKTPVEPVGDQLPCPKCDKSFGDRSGLGSHTRRVHGKSLAELQGVAPKFTCLRCDNSPTFASGTGFSAHRRSAHDLPVDAPMLDGEKLTDEPSRFDDKLAPAS